MLASNESQQVSPMVSVLMVAYMHESFIRQAIEGVLMQRTNFVFELVIGEDAGSDNTRVICEEYQHKYPGVIRLLPPEPNLGVMPNFIRVFDACRGTYIAICEGDDYWTSPLKLQRQLDTLSQNETASLCFHTVTRKIDQAREDQHPLLQQDEFDIYDVIEQEWFVPTSSIFFRKSFFRIPGWLSKIVNGDFALLLTLADRGNFIFLKEDMGVYRIHAGGLHRQFQDLVYRSIMVMQTLSLFNQDSNFRYAEKILHRKIALMESCNRQYADQQIAAWINRQPPLRQQLLRQMKSRLRKILGSFHLSGN